MYIVGSQWKAGNLTRVITAITEGKHGQLFTYRQYKSVAPNKLYVQEKTVTNSSFCRWRNKTQAELLIQHRDPNAM